MGLPTGWRGTGYELESGQAWVHRVTRHGSSEFFALKMLKSPRRRNRFEREVSTMKRLVEQGIDVVPPIIEQGLEQERPYYVIPWYAESLEKAVADGRYRENPIEGLDLLTKMAEAVQKVHAGLVAHRDLKPANVFRDEASLYLGDFGLCLDVESDRRITQTGEAIGSRLYIAPENEAGINESLDQRPGDFYAYGKILWALLAGREPPPRELALEEEWHLSRIVGNERLKSLDPLIARLLEPDHAARLVDWSEVETELLSVRGLLTGESTPASVAELRGALENARRLGQLPQVRAAIRDRTKMESGSRRLSGWEGRLSKEAAEEAEAIRLQLEAMTEAADGVLSFQVGPNAPSLSEAQARTFLPKPEHFYRSMSTGPLVAYGIYPFEKLFSELHLIVLFRRTDDAIWFTRLPALKSDGDLSIPNWLLSQTAITVGPLSLFLNQTVDQARKIVRGANLLFLAMCERYLAIVAAENDPGNAASWGDPPLELQGNSMGR